MVKPFADTAFHLKQGDISHVLQSDFGYHIIQLTGIKPTSAKTLDEEKSQIAADSTHHLAATKYTEMAESFTNRQYEHADSLQPVVWGGASPGARAGNAD